MRQNIQGACEIFLVQHGKQAFHAIFLGCGNTRTSVFTDAVEMGIDLQDVARAIQWNHARQV